MPQEREIRSNNKYPTHTAGADLELRVPQVHVTTTIEQVKSLLQKNLKDYETINEIYVLNHYNELVGILSIKDIFKSNNEQRVETIMKRDPVYIHPYTHRERASYLAMKYNLESLPVVDKNNKFLGVLDSNKILSIMYEELSEDFFKRTGHIGKKGYYESEDILNTSMVKTLKHRLPWVFVGAIGSLLMASIIRGYEETLSNNLVLASFIPLMVYISNAVAQQMNAFVIRDLALKNNISGAKYIFRNTGIVFIIAVAISSLVFLYSNLFKNSMEITYVLAAGVFFSIMSSITTGLVIPLIFSKLKFDPADTSGPIGTIVQDLLSIVIYFLIASRIL